MRTDVKIGVAVGLLVALGAMVYFVLSEPAEPPQGTGPGLANEPPQERQVAVQPEPTEIQSVIRSDKEIDEGLLIPRLGGSEAGTEAPARPTPVVPEPEVMSSAPKPPAEEGETPMPVRVKPAPPEPTAPAKPPTIAVPSSVKPTAPTRQRIYVVQEGDRGFWGIAKKQYGDGKYWPLIAQANPNADSNALRVGQRLIIPPKPDLGPRPLGTGRRQPAGGAGTSGTYVVVEGDKGFWDVAKKMYGDGKYWRLIADANPGVDSGALQPGQRLIIPPRRDVPQPSSRTPTPPQAAEPTEARPIFD